MELNKIQQIKYNLVIYMINNLKEAYNASDEMIELMINSVDDLVDVLMNKEVIEKC